MYRTRVLLFILTVFFTAHCGKDYQTLFDEGFQLRQLKQYDKARKKYLQALKIKKTKEVYKELGNTYLLKEKDLLTAEKYYLKSLNIDSKYVNAIHNMGIVYFKKWEKNKKNELLKKADSYFRKAIKIDPGFSLSYIELGKILFHAKDYQNAIKTINHSIQLMDNNYIAFHVLGVIYFEGLKNYKEAEYNLLKATKLNPDDQQATLLLAKIYLKRNKKKEAYKTYLKYLTLLKESDASKEEIQKAESDFTQYQ